MASTPTERDVPNGKSNSSNTDNNNAIMEETAPIHSSTCSVFVPPYNYRADSSPPTNTTDTGEHDEHDDWRLISQGAEARLWYVPSFLSSTSPDGTTTRSLPAVCKERFPKAYRHPTLDATLLKSRTKSEAKCLLRCRRGGVPCPAVLAYDLRAVHAATTTTTATTTSDRDDPPSSPSSSMCLFLEYVPGVTVRQFLNDTTAAMEQGSGSSTDTDMMSDNATTAPQAATATTSTSPPHKKLKNENDVAPHHGNEHSKGGTKSDGTSELHVRGDRLLRLVAHAVGTIIAKMHNVNIVHGDLTTSNMMVGNYETTGTNTTDDDDDARWTPRLVLIDFGLSGTAGAKGGMSHEEKAVDLYVLERALDSTHPECSDLLQAGILRAYKGTCTSSDSVLQRLAAVRQRGRKRECFG